MNRPQERFQFDVPTYRRMARNGILPRDAHVELLDGEIITMSPIGPNTSCSRHGCSKNW